MQHHFIYSFSSATLDADKKEFYDKSDLVFDVEQKNRFEELLSQISLPFSIVLDNYYVDKVYRDSYYRYFSSKHYSLSRNCSRIAFFEGDVDYNDFYQPHIS